MKQGAYPHILPDATELIRLREKRTKSGKRPTLEAIGKRYGVSRQAVHKAITKWQQEQAELANSVEVEVPVDELSSAS